MPRFERASRETSLCGSLKSPNTIALVGHDCTQAGWISPSFNFALFRLRLNFRGLDALHAERALLHHAHFAHGNIGIELQIRAACPIPDCRN